MSFSKILRLKKENATHSVYEAFKISGLVVEPLDVLEGDGALLGHI